MSKMRFIGFPAGQAEVSLSQAGQTASLTTTVPAESVFAEENCFYLKSSAEQTDWQGVSSTMGKLNGTDLGWGFSPPIYRRWVKASGDGNDRIQADGMDNATFTENLFIDATADVYRMRNGAIEMVRSSRVTGGHLGEWFKKATVSSESYDVFHPGWNARGERFYYGVAAIDGSELLGEIAYLHYDLPDPASGASSYSNANTVSQSYSEGGSLAAPTNLAFTVDPNGANGISLTWDAVPGAIAYVVFEAFSDPALFAQGKFLDLEVDGGVPVKDGDLVILTKRVMKPDLNIKSVRVTFDNPSNGSFIVNPFINPMNDPNQAVTHCYGDWTEADPAPGPEVGDSYIAATVAPGYGSERVLARFWASSAEQTFYRVPNVNESYRWVCWVEADRHVQCSFRSGLTGTTTQFVYLTPGWQKVEFNFSPVQEETGTSVRRWRFDVVDTSSEVNLRLAGLRMYETSAEFMEPPVPSQAQIPEKMFLRDHSQIKPGSKTTDVSALTNPAGCSPRESTLESFLSYCDKFGALPWIQIEWYHTIDDWLDILAYLAAPVSSGHPMALKRQGNGRTEPWTDAFDQIRFEFGNESWNGLSGFWTPPVEMTDEVTSETFDRAYIFGQICRAAALAMMASPYWDDKITWVLGGWARQSYSASIARSFALPCEVGIANYNGGWDEGDTIVSENDASYQAVMGVVPGATSESIDHLVQSLQNLADEPGFPLEYGTDLRPTCYEAGPGYQLNGLNGSSVTAAETIVQEVVMKSRAAAAGTLDTVLYQALRGFAVFNFFTISDGNLWRSRASEAQGGATFLSYDVTRVLMEQMGFCEVFQAQAVRPASTQITSREGDVIDVDAISVYGLKSKEHDGRFMLVVINRSVSENIPCSLFSALKSVDTMTVWASTGDAREHNRYPVGQRLSTDGSYTADSNSVDIDFSPQVMTVPADPARIDIDATFGVAGLDNGLPPGGFLLIQFDGAVFNE